MMEVVGAEVPIFVVGAPKTVVDAECCRVVDQVAAFAVVELVGVVVHEDVFQPADVVRHRSMVGGLQHQNQGISHPGRGEVHSHEVGDENQRGLELTDGGIDQRTLIATKKVQFGDAVVGSMLFAVIFQNRIVAAAMAHQAVDPVIGQIQQKGSADDQPPIVEMFAVQGDERKCKPSDGNKTSANEDTFVKHHGESVNELLGGVFGELHRSIFLFFDQGKGHEDCRDDEKSDRCSQKCHPEDREEKDIGKGRAQMAKNPVNHIPFLLLGDVGRWQCNKRLRHKSKRDETIIGRVEGIQSGPDQPIRLREGNDFRANPILGPIKTSPD